MSGWKGRSGLAWSGIGLAGVVVAAVTAFVLGNSPSQPFPSLTPRAAPAGWSRLALPNGTAVLSYPPATRPVAGDRDAVSVAERDTSGAVALYLNATPRQGDESLRNWATFRLSRLTADDASSAHKISSASGVRFRGGTGSCVMDDYITRAGAHHYQEIACLVQGRTGASVIVAAALTAQWKQARPVLEQAVAAYAVR
jgi:hypothetical protein